MKRIVALVAVTGLLSFAGCGGGDSEEDTATTTSSTTIAGTTSVAADTTTTARVSTTTTTTAVSGSTSGISAATIIGTWQLVSGEKDGETFPMRDNLFNTLYADGTYQTSGDWDEQERGTWTIQGNTVTTVSEDGSTVTDIIVGASGDTGTSTRMLEGESWLWNFRRV